MTPEAIRRRMAHGNIYGPDRVDAALSNYFRPGNLAALRELALLWVADKVDDSLQQYMEDHGIEGTWETRERVVVAITGAPGSEHLIRRAARMAQRSHGDLIGVRARSGDGLAEASDERLEANRGLLTDLGGEYHEVVGNDIGRSLARFAVVGQGDPAHPRSQSPESLVRAGPRLGHQQGDPAVGRDRRSRHLLRDRRRRGPPAFPGARPRRSALIPPTEDRGLGARPGRAARAHADPARSPGRDSTQVSTVFLLFLTLICLVSGWAASGPGSCAAVMGAGLTNWFFIEPYSTLDDRGSRADPRPRRVRGARRHHQRSREPDGPAAQRGPPGSGRGRGARRGGRSTGRPGQSPRGHARPHPDHVRPAVGGVDRPGSARTSGTSRRSTLRRAQTEPVDPTSGDRVEVTDDLMLVVMPGGLSGDDRTVLAAFAARLADELERQRPRTRRGDGRDAEPGRPAPHRHPPCRVARPPHAARLDQGIRHQPAPGRHRLERSPAPRVRPHDRRGDRPSRPRDRQPVGHEPDRGRRTGRDDRAGRASTRSSASALANTSGPTGADHRRRGGPDARCDRRLRACWSGWCPTWCRTPFATLHRTARSGSRPLRWATGRSSASSTGAPASPVAVREQHVRSVPATERPRHERSRSRVRGGRRGSWSRWAGELVLDDTPGGGLTVTLALPVRPSHGSHGARTDPGTGRPVTRVLVVDDEPQIRRALATNLRARDYEVDLAETGEQALALASRATPRPGGARHRPAGHRRRRGRPRPPWLDRRADHHAVGAGRGERQGRGARRRRRRLRDQAVRDERAAGPHARRRSTHRRPGPARRTPSSRPATSSIDLVDKRVHRDGDQVHLTPIEWGLVEALVRSNGRLVSQRQLLQTVWGPEYETGDELPAGAPGQRPPQARGRSVPPATLHHRAGNGLSLPARQPLTPPDGTRHYEALNSPPPPDDGRWTGRSIRPCPAASSSSRTIRRSARS